MATTLLLFITVERLKRLLNPQLQSDRSTLYQPGGYFCGVWAKVAYPTGCANKPRSYYDYDNNSCIPPRHLLRNRDEFQLLRRLGAGKFSDVFEAVIVNDKEMEVAQKQQQDFRPTHSTHPYADINDELGGVHDDDNDDAIDERSLVVIKVRKKSKFSLSANCLQVLYLLLQLYIVLLF